MKRKHLVMALITAAVATAIITGLAARHHASHTGDGTLQGTVTLYPIGPVCAARSTCSRAAAGQLVEVRPVDGSLTTKVTANDQGHYSFRLPPGSYVVTAPAARYGRGASDVGNPVQVSRNTTTTLDITIDTGIR